MLFGQHARPLQQPAGPEAAEDDADHDDSDARTGAPPRTIWCCCRRAVAARAKLNPLRIAGVSLAGFEALMSQKYRFQDVDEKSRQIFRQFDHGKGYITVDVRSRHASSRRYCHSSYVAAPLSVPSLLSVRAAR